jgi:PmbA protein
MSHDFSSLFASVERLLARCPHDAHEIFVASSRNLSIEAKGGKIDTFKCSAPVGVSLRLVKGRGIGFSFSTSQQEEDLARMVESAAVAAESQSIDEYAALPLPLPFPAVTALFDDALAQVPEREKVARALELERLTLAADDRIKRVRKASYSESSYFVAISSSTGLRGSYEGTSCSASVSAIAELNGEAQMGWEFDLSRNYDGLDIGKIARGAAHKAVGMLGAITPETMRVPVVLDNHVATEILELLAPSFLAENIQRGKSMLAGRLGKRLFSPLLTIVDDGLLPGGAGTAPFDGEGTPQQRTTVVSSGVVERFLYDLRSARRDRVDSTGNSSRGGVKAPPRPGVNNFFVAQGVTPRAELFRGISRGVLIEDVLGMHTANAISGDFSVGAAGHLIEDGVVTSPVKGIAISGNIIDLFHGIELVGDDLRFFGAIGSPSLRLAPLDVSGR